MTPYDVLKKAIEFGVEHDFRPRNEVLNYFWKERIVMPGGGSFLNVYPDTGIVHLSDPAAIVQRAVVGLDIAQDEMLTIKEFSNSAKKKIDLFIGHHPRGKPSSSFPFILKTQLGNLKSRGVKLAGLEKKYEEQMRESWVDRLSTNFNRTRDTAKLLDFNYISVHTPADNAGASFIEKHLHRTKPRTLDDCIESLLAIPEYRSIFDENQIAPAVISGKRRGRLGNFILTEFLGGEEGPLEVYRAMKRSGVETIISMHMSSAALRETRRLKLNVIAAGHAASDSLGLNLFCDILEKSGIEVIPIAGFIRHSRNQKVARIKRRVKRNK